MSISILNGIINAINKKPSLFQGKGAGYNMICAEIQQAAFSTGHPFVYFDGCVHVFTGNHWEQIDEYELKVFVKEAFAKLCGDYVSASKKVCTFQLTIFICPLSPDPFTNRQPVKQVPYK